MNLSDVYGQALDKLKYDVEESFSPDEIQIKRAIWDEQISNRHTYDRESPDKLVCYNCHSFIATKVTVYETEEVSNSENKTVLF